MKMRVILISIAIMTVIGIVVFGFTVMTFNFDQNDSLEQPSKVTFPHGTIRVDDVTLNVQIADTEPRIMRGIMFQERLPYDQGMIFLFDEPDIYPFWTMNMKFPLDMIWFDENGNVAHIETDVPPCMPISNSTICPNIIPENNSIYTLEVTSGFVEKFGITNDSKVLLFGNSLYEP